MSLEQVDARIAEYEGAQAAARSAIKMVEGHIAEFQKDLEGFRKKDRKIAKTLRELRKYRRLELSLLALRREREQTSEGREDVPAAV